MKIALIGYGKMGKTIEKIALDRGHSITSKIDSKVELQQLNSSAVDVAIEFTGPDSAFENISYCFGKKIPVVSGSTGWLHHLEEAKNLCEKNHSAFFYASNFSIGVNLFFKLNMFLAKLMNTRKDYNVSIEEIHHTEKKDSPSGTAITLAEQIINNSDKKSEWVNGKSTKENELEINSKRIDKVPGTHTINYQSSVDSIEIKHTAHSREGFALAAVLAAEWIVGKKGFFGMDDMLKF